MNLKKIYISNEDVKEAHIRGVQSKIRRQNQPKKLEKRTRKPL